MALTLKTEKLAADGTAIAHTKDRTVYIPGALEGETVLVDWTDRKKTHGHARLFKVIEPSPLRIEAPCSYFKKGCGGCQWQMASYENQLKFKADAIKETFSRIAHIKPDDLPLDPCIGMSDPWDYRNKAQYPLKRSPYGRLLTGYYQPGTHHIIDLNDCPVESPMIKKALAAIKNLLETRRTPIYDEKEQKNGLRYLCLRASERTGEILIILVSTHAIEPTLLESLRNLEIPGLKGIVENVNDAKTNVIYAKESRVLWGVPYYHEKISDKTLRVSALSFFQINTAQTEAVVKDLLGNMPATCENLLEGYSGIGTFSVFLSARAKSVVSIEDSFHSTSDAEANNAANGAGNVRIIKKRVEDVIDDSLGAIDFCFFDPPRQGLHTKVITALIAKGPSAFAYLSCDPATLARDTKLLLAGGYQLKRLAPFDMFPHTHHVECLAYFSR
ncbi:MAG: 23S rRNA (uracil(1939)-C(5))-methyltransferase RlmD [Elusimicrobiota bacterium]